MENVDARTQKQASELMACMAQLMEATMISHEPPFPDLELSPREIRVLIVLGDRGEMIMTDLAAAVQAPLSTVTRIVDRLHKKGLVERCRSEQDRRIVVITGSEKGKRLHNEARQHQLTMAYRMLEPLSSGEREILLELMAKLIRVWREP